MTDSAEPEIYRLDNSVASPKVRLLFAHGAGAPMDSEFMNLFSELCRKMNISVVRFEFPYMTERRQTGKKRPPNKKSVLLETWSQVVSLYRDDPIQLFIGGKSMGGRMATLWCKEDLVESVKGVVCLGYPFHPAGKPDTLRIEHLPDISVPVLMVQGTRDRLGNAAEVAGYDLGESVNVIWVDTGDHDLKPLKSSGRTQYQALEFAVAQLLDFMLKTGG